MIEIIRLDILDLSLRPELEVVAMRLNLKVPLSDFLCDDLSKKARKRRISDVGLRARNVEIVHENVRPTARKGPE